MPVKKREERRPGPLPYGRGSEEETRLGGQGRTPVKRDRERIHRKDNTI